MKRLHELASEIGVHPVDLLVELQRLGARFEDSWPAVLPEWEGTLRGMHAAESPQMRRLDPDGEMKQPAADATPLTGDELRVLDKLARGRYWKASRISAQSLGHQTRLGRHQLADAVRALRSRGLVLAEGSDKEGPFSLDPRHRAEVARHLGQIQRSASQSHGAPLPDDARAAGHR